MGTVCVGNPNHWNHLILKKKYCYKINNCFYEFVYARHHLAKIVSISVAISVMQWESMHLFLALHCSTYEPIIGNQNHSLGFFLRCILPVKFDSCMCINGILSILKRWIKHEVNNIITFTFYRISQ